MKIALILSALFSAIAYAATTDLTGTWRLASRECSSQAPVNDGLMLNHDEVQITYDGDSKFFYKSVIHGCAYWAAGTYEVDNDQLQQTILESQSCKDESAKSTRMTLHFTVTQQGEHHLTLATSGTDAAAVCPPGDTLLSHYLKTQE